MTPPDGLDLLCQDPTCPAYGQPHGPDHDAAVDAAEPDGPGPTEADVRRLVAAATHPAPPGDLEAAEARHQAGDQLRDSMTTWLPPLLAELGLLRQRIVTIDLDGRTVRYDQVAECDAALAATEQRLEQALRDRDAAQAHAYRTGLQVTAYRDRLQQVASRAPLTREQVRAAIDGAVAYDDATDRVMALVSRSAAVPGSGAPVAPAADPGPGMPHRSSGAPAGPQAPVQRVAYEGWLDVHQPPDGPAYPVLRLTGGLGGTVVYRPDAVVRVTTDLHRDGELLVRQYADIQPATDPEST